MYPSDSFMPYFSTSLSSLRCHLLTSSVTQTFLFMCKYIGGSGLVAKSYLALVTPWTVSCQALCPWDSLGQNTGVGCHFLLQRNLSNPGIKPKYIYSYSSSFPFLKGCGPFWLMFKVGLILEPWMPSLHAVFVGFFFFLVVVVSLLFCCFNKHGLF